MIFFLTVWILFSPTFLSENKHFSDLFIVWNVGQGQWVTLDTLEVCYHFDLGGEFFPLKKISSLCQHKQNEIYISHWDIDHISALKHISNWPRVCRRLDPLGESSPQKMKWLAQFKICSDDSKTKIQKIFPDHQEEKKLPEISNAQSQVLVVRHWLVPGDSRREEEALWSQRLSLHKITGLVLGHHGSKTSNSDLLIRRLPELRWAIASARWRRYKHPHPSVLMNFKKQKKRVLRTEDWGNFYFQANNQ